MGELPHEQDHLVTSVVESLLEEDLGQGGAAQQRQQQQLHGGAERLDPHLR